MTLLEPPLLPTGSYPENTKEIKLVNVVRVVLYSWTCSSLLPFWEAILRALKYFQRVSHLERSRPGEIVHLWIPVRVVEPHDVATGPVVQERLESAMATMSQQEVHFILFIQ
jgi:hypothetical protein